MAEPQQVDLSNIDSFTSPSTATALLEFWAPWCAPCLALAPVMRELTHDLRGVVAVGRVDIESAPDVAARFGIVTTPTLLLLHHGQAVATVQGFQPAATLKSWIREVLRTSGPA